MFPIYGMLVLLEPVHEKVKDASIVIRGGVYTALILSGEFLTGMFLRLALGKCPWNYGIDKYSIYGLITLKYIPVWFVFGLLFEKLYILLIEAHIGNDRFYKK
jgi:hypothetical protein